MTTPSQAAPAQAPAPAQSINGTAPAADPGECADCATPGQKGLAVFGMAVGAVVLLMAIDVFTDYRLSRSVGLGKQGGGPSDDTGS